MREHHRVAVWVDSNMERALARFAIPGVSRARLLRLLLHAALAEAEGTQLSEGARSLAPVVWAAVAQRRKRPVLIEKLPRFVDEYLEAVEAPLATRAKTYALLLALPPLERFLLIAEGARMTRSALGGESDVDADEELAQLFEGEEEADVVDAPDAAPAP